MKSVIIFTVLLATLGALVSAQPAGALKYPAYTLSAGTSAGSNAAFIVATPDTGAGLVGLSYREDSTNLGTTPVLEILDGTTGKLLKSISAAEYFGTEDSSWTIDAAESSSDSSSVKTAFDVKAGKKSFELIRTVETLADANLPLGKSLRVSFAIKSGQAMSVKIRYTGKAVGTATAKAGGFWISGSAATLVFHLSAATTVAVSPAKKGVSQSVTATTAAVKVASSKATEVLTISVLATSTTISKFFAQQAGILQKYAETKKAGAPVMVNAMIPSKAASVAGDTVTYTLYYDNIGLSPAADISVSDPLDARLAYVDGSAAGEGSEITFDKTPGTPPAHDRVTKINWKFAAPVLPGEGRVVSFRAIVQ